MLGDWDLQSTLLRRALQAGARLRPAPESCEPLLAQSADDLELFERPLIAKSRGARTDFASRYVLPLVEDFATEWLMETRVRPEWLVHAALLLTVAAAFAFSRGWLWPAVGCCCLSTPLDLIARRWHAAPAAAASRAHVAALLWPARGSRCWR